MTESIIRTIKATTLFDGKGKQSDKTISIDGDRISDVSNSLAGADIEGFVTPAIIDAHSHIGMQREGEPYQDKELSDSINHIQPLSDPLNGIYFDDRAFSDAVDFGVLYSCVVPGSANLIGGQAKIIRNYAKNRSEALVKDYGYKMALGYNTRVMTDWKGERPNTRMGAYALLEKKFDDVVAKRDKAILKKEKGSLALADKNLTDAQLDTENKLLEREFELEFTPEEKSILKLLDGRCTAKVHVHKDDDVLYLIDLVKKYGLKVTADHTCDVFQRETFDALADANIPVVYGPTASLGYKVELKNARYQNTEILMKSRAYYGLMTDHPVILTYMLKDTLKYFLIYGMSDEEAFSIITYKNAKILGIDNKLGTVEPGKLASLVVWDRNPLHAGAYPKAVIAEGRVLRRRNT